MDGKSPVKDHRGSCSRLLGPLLDTNEWDTRMGKKSDKEQNHYKKTISSEAARTHNGH